MKFIVAIFRWAWRFITLLAHVAPGLFGISIIAGFVSCVVALFVGTYGVMNSVQESLSRVSDGVISDIGAVFDAINAHSLGGVLAYCLSLDYIFRWLASFSEFVLNYIVYAVCGVFLTALEGAILIVGTYFIRKRVSMLSAGLGGANE